jgi:hypothetical protein
MKTIIFILNILFLSKSIFAQESLKSERVLENNPYILEFKSSNEKHQLATDDIEKELQLFLINNFKELSQSELRLITKNKGPYSKHFLYAQYYKGIKIYNSSIKVNLTKSNETYNISYSIANTKDWNLSTDLINENTTDNLIFTTVESIVLVQNNIPLIAQLYTYKNPYSGAHTETVFVNHINTYQRDLNSYFAHDTIVRGYVYNPDPLSVGNNTYGGRFVNNADSTNVYFDSKRELKSVRATDTLGVFYLNSPFCSIVEADPPVKNPVTSIDGDFMFNRFDDGFEDFNTFYHINTMHDYINNDLGFALVNYPITCDVHAIGGADNSFFTFSTSPPSLRFGEGGVDDAEDADVVIHEYCHAVSHDASPFTNIGTERISLDEGFCDYIACSYSKSLYPFNANWVFNWDGHNEYWSGRFVDNINLYPRDLNGNIYHNGGIWSSALWEIEGKLGREKGNKLAIQTMYANANNITLEQAAKNYLYADTLLYAGADYCKIVHSFILRGLLDPSYGNSCDFTGIENNTNSDITIYNTLGFAEGTGDLMIKSSEILKIKLYTIDGSLILEKELHDTINFISSEKIPAGIYLLKLENKLNSNSIKLIKF